MPISWNSSSYSGTPKIELFVLVIINAAVFLTRSNTSCHHQKTQISLYFRSTQFPQNSLPPETINKPPQQNVKPKRTSTTCSTQNAPRVEAQTNFACPNSDPAQLLHNQTVPLQGKRGEKKITRYIVADKERKAEERPPPKKRLIPKFVLTFRESRAVWIQAPIQPAASANRIIRFSDSSCCCVAYNILHFFRLRGISKNRWRSKPWREAPCFARTSRIARAGASSSFSRHSRHPVSLCLPTTATGGGILPTALHRLERGNVWAAL